MSYCSQCRSVSGYNDGVGWCADCGRESVFVSEFDECRTVTHRTDPRTMEERWRSMGWSVEWSEPDREYAVKPSGENLYAPAMLRTVDEVEAYVTAHASGKVGT